MVIKFQNGQKWLNQIQSKLQTTVKKVLIHSKLSKMVKHCQHGQELPKRSTFIKKGEIYLKVQNFQQQKNQKIVQKKKQLRFSLKEIQLKMV